MKVERVDNNSEVIYSVQFDGKEVKEFMKWLFDYEYFTVIVNGQLYRFKNLQEKAFFVFGMDLMYEMYSQPTENASVELGKQVSDLQEKLADFASEIDALVKNYAVIPKVELSKLKGEE